ncbi:tetratricopeptide repeat protein, partial [Streptomyces sp. NPDC019890]|uniref:tetratricopeptide repeat protein n=1 Tax=Streptomyces sp. NPDC019890 TaxID=3365064 RepID=UPI0038514016
HFEDALADFERAIELDSQIAWAYAGRGETHRLMGSYNDALTDLDHAIELDSQIVWAIACRGHTHQGLEHFEDALADFERAIELDSQIAWAYAGRGETHRHMGCYEKALTDLARAAEIDPGDGWYLYETAIVLHVMPHPDRDTHLARAAELFVNAAADGDTAGSLRANGNLFIVQCAMQAWEKANRVMEHFLNSQPDTRQLRATLTDLKEATTVFSLNTEHIGPLRNRLQTALDEQLPQ